MKRNPQLDHTGKPIPQQRDANGLVQQMMPPQRPLTAFEKQHAAYEEQARGQAEQRHAARRARRGGGR
jgi:hypothetical protein